MARPLTSTAAACFAFLGCLAAGPAFSADDPDLVSFGLGHYDHRYIDPAVIFLDSEGGQPEHGAVDFRFEYRFGRSLLPVIEDFAKLKPWVGVEATSDGALYGAAGILFDIPVGPFIVTPSFGAGLYHDGAGKDLGSLIEFRSMLEVGYRFENEMRITAQFSHISNAGITRNNPGSNILGAYLHLPAGMLFD